ncbi:hypothetical protein [Noviherbaspirillum sp.]|uniref:hypothetical protein n=1 Tax=Noviherbaspirillum sp. TaxID=1926288 RepID=UPI002B46C2F7|nr:hypothetical protein [Noviherbaspirillum sp.]HJV82380.1 hypothetical protein [Noviherbaspirillum sp.]
MQRRLAPQGRRCHAEAQPHSCPCPLAPRTCCIALIAIAPKSLLRLAFVAFKQLQILFTNGYFELIVKDFVYIRQCSVVSECEVFSRMTLVTAAVFCADSATNSACGCGVIRNADL